MPPAQKMPPASTAVDKPVAATPSKPGPTKRLREAVSPQKKSPSVEPDTTGGNDVCITTKPYDLAYGLSSLSEWRRPLVAPSVARVMLVASLLLFTRALGALPPASPRGHTLGAFDSSS